MTNQTLQNSDVSARTPATLTTLSYHSARLKPSLNNICEGLIRVLGKEITKLLFYIEIDKCMFYLVYVTGCRSANYKIDFSQTILFLNKTGQLVFIR